MVRRDGGVGCRCGAGSVCADRDSCIEADRQVLNVWKRVCMCLRSCVLNAAVWLLLLLLLPPPLPLLLLHPK